MSLTNDIDARFERMFPTCCDRIGCKPIDLLGVMMSESGVAPAARNPNGGAVGLIQFMPATLLGLGWKRGPQAFACLSASDQLPWVAAYFTPWKKDGAPFDSAARVYQAVFLPGTLKRAKELDDVLAAKRGTLGWAYEANAVFDANGDGRITLGELGEAVRRNAKGPRWRELLERLGLAGAPELVDVDGDAHVVETCRDVQFALQCLGYDPGPVDGILGPKTKAAIKAFQADAELHVDGIAGPATRKELERRLDDGPATLREPSGE